MAILGTKTSSDTNSSADINTLSSRAFDKQGLGQIAALVRGVPVTGDYVLGEKGGSTNDLQAFSIDDLGGGSTEPNLFFKAGSGIYYPISNPAPLNTRNLTNGFVKEHLHNDATNESIAGQYRVPSDIDTAGTVTFYWFGSPATAAADEVVYVFRHSPAGDTEDIDVAFTTEASAATTMSATQDALNIITWTETVANLGWAGSDFLRWIVERDAAGTYQSGDNLSGDCATWFFYADIPRA